LIGRIAGGGSIHELLFLHANFKQKPKSVPQKKEKEEFEHTTMRDYLERK
jgi:hypothetical protein